MTLTDRLAEYFREWPGRWIDGEALSQVAGRYAWRSRVSDVRRRHGMTIENRQRTVREGERRWVVSEYRYVPATITPVASESTWELRP